MREPIDTYKLKDPVKQGDKEITEVNIYACNGYVMELIPEPSLAKNNITVGEFYPALQRLIKKERSFILDLSKDDLTELIGKLGE